MMLSAKSLLREILGFFIFTSNNIEFELNKSSIALHLMACPQVNLSDFSRTMKTKFCPNNHSELNKTLETPR
ncbi:CLUMA_CG004238, isoform A [Clunio marinus]|uniref:CLUMA_CG004238, isoform A n=1 Tax=Clunio marinus TaxID=568069 RepID=A0A1J1HVL0_9DIPT|nr:CLUMA_CG004238, isoform A [Clunio marinus]